MKTFLILASAVAIIAVVFHLQRKIHVADVAAVNEPAPEIVKANTTNPTGIRFTPRQVATSEVLLTQELKARLKESEAARDAQAREGLLNQGFSEEDVEWMMRDPVGWKQEQNRLRPPLTVPLSLSGPSRPPPKPPGLTD